MNKELSANTELSHYRIVSKTGAGGMGEVYLAHDTKLDRKVAIKFLNEEFSKDPDKLNRFVQEAKAASALNHPNILTIHEIGELDGTNYIVTELIDGKTLRAHLSHKDSLQLNEILKIGVQVSEALSAAHQALQFARYVLQSLRTGRHGDHATAVNARHDYGHGRLHVARSQESLPVAFGKTLSDQL